MNLKLPSHDNNAEESLLISLLSDNQNYYDLEALEPDDFYKLFHKEVFRSIVNLINKQQTADFVTVGHEIKSRIPDLDLDLLLKLNSYPESVNPKAHSKVIRACSIVRNISHRCLDLGEKGFNNPDPDKYIDDFYKLTTEIEVNTSDKILTSLEFSNMTYDGIQEALKRKESDGIHLGFPEIDELISLVGSKLILIAARPGIGKTSFLTSVVENMCTVGRSAGVLEIEMDNEDIGNRIVGKLADINPQRFKYSGSIKEDEETKIVNACSEISRWKLFIDDSGCKIEDVKRKCRKMKKLGCDAIFIDQLSKISGTGNQFERYTENCTQIALLKKELRIPIFLLCQINREGAERPTMANLKQTGMLEEDADLIFILHRKPDEEMVTDVILAKHRQGATQEFKLNFNKIRSTFNEVR